MSLSLPGAGAAGRTRASWAGSNGQPRTGHVQSNVQLNGPSELDFDHQLESLPEASESTPSTARGQMPPLNERYPTTGFPTSPRFAKPPSMVHFLEHIWPTRPLIVLYNVQYHTDTKYTRKYTRQAMCACVPIAVAAAAAAEPQPGRPRPVARGCVRQNGSRKSTRHPSGARERRRGGRQLLRHQAERLRPRPSARASTSTSYSRTLRRVGAWRIGRQEATTIQA